MNAFTFPLFPGPPDRSSVDLRVPKQTLCQKLAGAEVIELKIIKTESYNYFSGSWLRCHMSTVCLCKRTTFAARPDKRLITMAIRPVGNNRQTVYVATRREIFFAAIAVATERGSQFSNIVWR